jgi:hypothetical protein
MLQVWLTVQHCVEKQVVVEKKLEEQKQMYCYFDSPEKMMIQRGFVGCFVLWGMVETLAQMKHYCPYFEAHLVDFGLYLVDED